MKVQDQILRRTSLLAFVTPVKAGVQALSWIPAFAGMTGCCPHKSEKKFGNRYVPSPMKGSASPDGIALHEGVVPLGAPVL